MNYELDLDTSIKWIQLILNFLAIGIGGWIYKTYVENLKSAISSKEEQVKVTEKHLSFWKDKANDLEKRSPEFMESALNLRIKTREDEIKRLSEDKETHKKEIEIQQQELSVLRIELEKTKDYRTKLSFIGEDFDDYFFSREGDLEIVEIGMVGVDSGQLMITDPLYIRDEWQEEEYEDLRIYKDTATGKTYQYQKDFQNYQNIIEGFDVNVNELIKSERFKKVELKRDFNYSYAGASYATLTDEGYGELKFKNGETGAGVSFRTAFGDGIYPVYGEKYDDKLIRIYVNVI
ncbi:hypothetical protein [Chryseobacterium aquaticum]|uniref:hypothetical protein n=1 Tax=Chryseobacterium aquaticum TaxID=452084 RepID=UPI002FC960E2